MHPINRALSRFGFQVHRVQQQPADCRSEYVKMLDHFGITLILDVGAHEGVTAQHLFENGYRGRIISFEPVRKHFAVLSAKCIAASEKGHRWEALQFAIGDKDEESFINIANNGLSSSLTDMLPMHMETNSESHYVGRERIDIRRLDSMFPKLIQPHDKVLLLLDVQGFEPQALEGAQESLDGLTGVQLEIGFRQAYASGFDVPTAFGVMSAKGFTPCYVEPAWKDTRSFVFYQVDVLWFRIQGNNEH